MFKTADECGSETPGEVPPSVRGPVIEVDANDESPIGCPDSLAVSSLAAVGGSHDNIVFTRLPSGRSIVRKKLTKEKDLRNELSWYETVGKKLESAAPQLAEIMPEYVGKEVADNGTDLILEDITASVCNGPTCVLDVKLGTRTFREDVSREPDVRYVSKLKAKFNSNWNSKHLPSKYDYMKYRDAKSTSSTFGFRISGGRIWKYEASAETPENRRKLAMFTLSRDARYSAWTDTCTTQERAAYLTFAWYFRGFSENRRREVVLEFVQKIEKFRRILAGSTYARESTLVGTSLLLVYDSRGKVDLRWIDFGNTNHNDAKCGEEGSESYQGILVGLECLSAILRSVALFF